MKKILWITIAISFAFQLSSNPVEAGWPSVDFPSDAGITLQKGNTYNILWSSVNTDPVDIKLCNEIEPSYIDCFYDIALNVPNSGQYSWTIPASLPNNSNYVISVGKILVSGASSDFPFTINDQTQIPLLPPRLSYTIDGVRASISWTLVSGATGYKLYYAPAPYSGLESIAEIDMGTQTTLSADLWEGASFLVAVQSYNDLDISNYSNIETITIPYTSAPESPPLSYNLDGTNLSATWGAVSGATGYKLYYTLSAYTGQEAFLPLDVGNQTSFSYQGLAQGQTYSIAVVAYNDVGESDFSNVETFTVEVAPPNPEWVDNDGDGFTESDGDCDDQDISINPSAEEICSDGIDQDCDGSDTACSISGGTHDSGQEGDFSRNPMSFTDNGDGTITDNLTGLLWQKTDDDQTYTLEDATNYCNALNIGDATDWRLPSGQELVNIVDFGAFGPSINSVFEGTESSNYWTSTSRQVSGVAGSQIQVVNFESGASSSILSILNVNNRHNVRCVSGEEQASSYRRHFSNTVIAEATNLLWQIAAVTPATWQESFSYCNNLTLDGYDDWRLPHVKELASIMSPKGDPAIDMLYFAGTHPRSPGFWTSTTFENNASEKWTVGFKRSGGIGTSAVTSEQHTRCVRDGID